jgi:hypothetical protein
VATTLQKAGHGPLRSWRFDDPRFAGAVVALLALTLSAIFVGVNLYYNHGYLTAPLDDSYIHLQYAKQIAQGHFLQYNSGDPISTGASSFLYALVLALPYLLGFHGTYLLAFSLALGIVSLAVTSVLVYAIGSLLVSRAVGLWAGVLTAVNGALLWAATSGMEVLLLAMLVTATLLVFTIELQREEFSYTPALAALAALTRPEGLLFSIPITGVLFWKSAVLIHTGRPSARRRLACGAYSLAPLLAVGVQLLFYLFTTGVPSASGVRAKSLLYGPVLYPPEFLSQTFSNLQTTLGTFGGLFSFEYVFLGALLFSVLGGYYVAVSQPNLRSVPLVSLGGFLLVSLGSSTLGTAHWQHFRYLLPFLPILLVFAVAGIYSLAFLLPSYRSLSAYVGVGLALLFSTVVLPIWAARTGQESETIREGDISAAHWIRKNVPASMTVGVDDAGAIAYLGGHRTLDMIGLTNRLTNDSRDGVGSLYEALENMDPKQRPSLFAIYNHWWPVPVDQFKDAGLLKPDSLATFDLRDTYRNAEAVFQSVNIFQADWTVAHSGDLPQETPTSSIKDSLDIADLQSERAHSYQMDVARTGLEPPSTLKVVSYPNNRRVADGGRRIPGSESFVLHNLMPGQALTLVGRDQAVDMSTVPVEVFANGADVGTWHIPMDAKGWKESSFAVPASLIKGSTAQIALKPEDPTFGPFPDRWSFHYWAMQPSLAPTRR